MTDNWQERLVEKLAKEKCEYCEAGYPFSENWPEFHVAAVKHGNQIKICTANRWGLRDAIRRTLEHAVQHFLDTTVNYIDNIEMATALRQLAGKEE